MKSYLYILPAIALMACGGGAETDPASDTPATDDAAASTVIITGEILSPIGEDVKVSGITDFVTYDDTKFSETELDENGNFRLEFDLDAPTMARLHHGKENTQMWLVPGDSVNLSMSAAQFDESIVWSGDEEMTVANNYLAAKYLLREQQMEAEQGAQPYMAPPAEFKVKAMAKRDEVQQLKDEKLSALTSSFTEAEQIAIDYDYYVAMARYPSYAPYYQGVEEVVLPDDFTDYEAAARLDLDAGLTVTEYVRYVDLVVSQWAQERFVEGANYYATQYDVATENLTGAVRDYAVSNAVYNTLRYEGSQPIADELYTNFKKDYPESVYMAAMEEQLSSWANLKAGMPAPVITAAKQDGESVSLDQYAGSLIYVDVWATWCGPCRQEIPDLKALEEEMHDENIVFVSVSVDADYEAWETMVAEEQLGGLQLIDNDAWDAEIADQYNINGIPRFIMIDAEGNIVDADAPRPSSGDEIRNLIRENLPEPSLAGQ